MSNPGIANPTLSWPVTLPLDARGWMVLEHRKVEPAPEDQMSPCFETYAVWVSECKQVVIGCLSCPVDPGDGVWPAEGVRSDHEIEGGWKWVRTNLCEFIREGGKWTDLDQCNPDEDPAVSDAWTTSIKSTDVSWH